MQAVPEDIHILESPTDFYGELMHGIRTAKHRIALASLYVGHTETELASGLANALEANPSLRLHILVDHMRGTRPDRNGESTATLLAPLVRQFPAQASVSLFEFPTNNPLRKLVPARFNEAFGLQHIKAYVFDDNVIISGANLNKDYFTDRQDRYILIKNNKQVANYFTSLLETIGHHSNSISPKVSQDPVTIVKSTSTLADISKALTTFSTTTTATLPPNALSTAALPTLLPSETATTITPILQSGPCNLQTETHFLTSLLQNLRSSPTPTTTVLSSAYFNLPSRFQTPILRASDASKFEFLLAAPEANGFFGSKGVSRHLPFAYTFLVGRFWDKVVALGQVGRIQVKEYKREGWTYHAKGIWISTPTTPTSGPHMTVIGSSNYGYRSFSRDLEAGVVIRTRDVGLQTRLRDNLARLQGYCGRVDEGEFGRVERRPGVFVRIAARIVKTML
ncbi:CDP-diacylglycerol--glycerol-3-phosphate 3-phosphatidyltransferase [Podochytrium sp. JEL0797]|nr:CDP-diacylglycerol--glycerol-3-phosphate 3-phosphatidyltransferase [Podochytrium sp. JEL0797]